VSDFIGLEQFKQRYGITSPDRDVEILEHIAAASARVRGITQRDFGAHVGAATVRYFRPLSCEFVLIDDASEISTVEIDTGDTGTYETTWAASDYETKPDNGIGPDGLSGWPTYSLCSVGTVVLPVWNRRRSIKVTAKWGWAAIPDAVIEATYLLTNRYLYEKSVPGGLTAPNPDFGIPGAPLRRQYTVEDLLAPYVRADKAIGVAG
jgi:hypothetical protein